MEEKRINKGRIIVIEGDITETECEAVVNAANNHLWMGSGVAGAIKRKGGRQIEEEAVRLGPIEVGQAVVTSAGNLKAKYVIHAAVMGQDLQTDAAKIRNATRSALKRGKELGVESIALPAFGTGVGGFPPGECASLMLNETRAFLDESGMEVDVTFALFGADAYGAFADALGSL